MTTLRECLEQEPVLGHLYLTDGEIACLPHDLLRGHVPGWRGVLLDVETSMRLHLSGEALEDAPPGKLSGVIQVLHEYAGVAHRHFLLRRLPNVLDRLLVYRLWSTDGQYGDGDYDDSANWLPGMVTTVELKFESGPAAEVGTVNLVVTTMDGGRISIEDCIRSGRSAWRPMYWVDSETGGCGS